MTQHAFLVIGQYGILIVFINVLVDQIGLPVPAVPTLVAAGALAADGRLPLVPLYGWSVIACLIPDCGWYAVGQAYGIRVLKLLCRISLEPDSCVSQTQTRFERWGVNSLVIAKFIPGLAIIAPPLAGAMRIGWARYLVLSTASGALWVGSAVFAGMLFRTQIATLMDHLGDIGNALAVMGGAALAIYIAYKWWQRVRFFHSLRMARINVAELYDLMQAGANPFIVDVRSPTARALEPRWIPGAVNVSLEEVARHLRDMPRNRDVIVYCTCPSEASAARVARILMNHGFRKVRPLYGGLDAWIAAGYAVDGTAEPALERINPP
jgi:membrane protein DedA with SNARE-associated domain/rhodanese-related sulfurtransferase